MIFIFMRPAEFIIEDRIISGPGARKVKHGVSINHERAVIFFVLAAFEV